MKKTVAVILSLFMLLSAETAFASAEAAAELGSYGIMQGDPDGNLRLDDSISRAEFAKMIMAAKEAREYTPAQTAFTDVDETHWASGYIGAAADSGILNGMGDGTFAPGAPVTHEQAVKMVVCALGYGEAAEENGGYPAGYYAVAAQLGIMGSFPQDTLAAARSEIAVLLTAALDVPLAVTKDMFYFGDDGRLAAVRETIIFNGEDKNALKTFRTVLEEQYGE